MQGFWKIWMTIWCWGVLLFGVVLALVVVPVADAAPRFVFAMLSGDRAKVALLDQSPMKFGLGLQGALTIGWALTMLTMVRAANVGGAPIWRALTVALLAWFVIDSAISVITGFPLNAVSNALLMASYLASVLATGVWRTDGGARAAPSSRP